MPQPYNHAVVTDAGISLLNKAQAGQCAIQFTRIATGNGIYEAAEKTASALQKRTGLKSEKNSYPLSSVGLMPGGGVKVTAMITNQDPSTGETLVNEGYYINEIGLFAREKGAEENNEVLYSITTAVEDGDYMPAYDAGNPTQIVQEYRAMVSRDVEVSVQYSGAVMLADGDASNTTVTFQQAEERADIQPGDSLETAFGKLTKYFADMATVAFSGSYDDLDNRPEIPGIPDSLPADGGNAATVGGKTVDDLLDYRNFTHTPHIPVIPESLPANGGDADTIGGKDLDYIMNYDNMENAPPAPTAQSLGLISTQTTAQLSTEWTGAEVPYSQTITVSGVNTDSVVDIDVAGTVTAEQLDAYINAKIVDGGQAAGSITLKAFGDKPEVAIPIKIVIRKV